MGGIGMSRDQNQYELGEVSLNPIIARAMIWATRNLSWPDLTFLGWLGGGETSSISYPCGPLHIPLIPMSGLSANEVQKQSGAKKGPYKIFVTLDLWALRFSNFQVFDKIQCWLMVRSQMIVNLDAFQITWRVWIVQRGIHIGASKFWSFYEVLL